MEERKKIIPSDPTPYNASSEPERASWLTLLNLLGTKYFDADIKTASTIPDTDGIIAILNEERVRVARVDVQLKTLEEKNYESPKYQCDLRFLSYCERSLLPVLLIAVNNKGNIAYWLHIDEQTLHDAMARLKGESISIPIPKENCISLEHTEFRQQWIEIYNRSWEKLWNFDQTLQRQKALETEVANIKEQTENPIHLPLDVLKGLHRYLDEYNYILDIEFPTVKSIMYPNYWKIGMGVISYRLFDITYILYPIPYQRNQVMIKDVKLPPGADWHNEMFEGRALMLAIANNVNELIWSARQEAYKRLDSPVLKIIEENNFAIPSEFLAREYLLSFIDRYVVYLDLDPMAQSYSLKELVYNLMVLLPMYEGTDGGFVNREREYTSSIDHHYRDRPSENHKRFLDITRKRIKDGEVPTVKVTITSEKYNIDLIYYYVHFLNDKNIQKVERVYTAPIRDENKAGELWKTWYPEVLWANFQVFISNLDACLTQYIKDHFFKLQHALAIKYEGHHTRLYVFYEYNGLHKPHVELFVLKPKTYEEGKILFVKEADSPINRPDLAQQKYECVFEGKPYSIMRIQGQPLDFMFTPSPTYTFIKDHITGQLRSYFNSQERK